MSVKGQGHSLTLVKGHSDFKVKCLTFGLYTQVSDSGPKGPLVHHYYYFIYSFISFFFIFSFKFFNLNKIKLLFFSRGVVVGGGGLC